jgi:hypothetical protein
MATLYAYVSCAGDSRANGLYSLDTNTPGIYNQSGGTSKIEYDYANNRWELKVLINSTYTTLYRFQNAGASGADTNVISQINWEAVGAASLPVPKTFDWSPAGIPTIRVSLASDIPNGNYTWNPNITYAPGHSVWSNGLSGAFVSDSNSSYLIGRYSTDYFRIANASTAFYQAFESLEMPLNTLWYKLSPYGASIVTTSLPGSTITLTGAGTAGVNGTYTWNSHILVNYSTNSSTYSMGYLHSDGTYVIAVDGTQTWSVLNVANGSKYYSSAIPYSQIPTGSFTHDGFFDLGTQPAPSSSYSSANLCSGGGGASAPVMKILMKTVPVVVITGSSLYPQINGIYYLANPGNGHNSFFSKDGGDSYPRIIYDNSHDADYPWVIKLNFYEIIYYGGGNYAEDWPGFVGFNSHDSVWYYEASGTTADITTSSSTVNRPHIYKRGNTGYGRT